MCALPILALPSLVQTGFFAYSLWRDARLVLPPVEDGPNGQMRNIPTMGGLVPVLTSPGIAIQASLEPFLNRIGMRRDLAIIAPPYFHAQPEALGSNFFTGGAAFIICSDSLHQLDRDASAFIIKHEIAHIKNNDLITRYLVGIITSLAVAILTMAISVIPLPAAIGLTVLGYYTSSVAICTFQRYTESSADDVAIENSSNEELLGGRRSFIYCQQDDLSHGTTFWDRIINFAIGETHPSMTSRIEKIERELQRRNVTINASEEAPKIAALRNFFLGGNTTTPNTTEQPTLQPV